MSFDESESHNAHPDKVIHPTALIDASAEVHPSARIGAYAVIGPRVTIEANTVIGPHCHIEGYTIIGQRCLVSSSSAIGGLPQDLGYRGEESWLIIGDDVQVREYVTMHRASGEGQATRVGNKCLIMASTHIAHNCELAEGVVMSSGAILGGHVHVGKHAFIGGQTVTHQHCRLGDYSLIGGASATRTDIPPYCKADGRTVHLFGLNVVALRRHGFSAADRLAIQHAYRVLWQSHLKMRDAIAYLRDHGENPPFVEDLLQFIESSKRGVAHPAIRKNPVNDVDSTHESPDTLETSTAVVAMA